MGFEVYRPREREKKEKTATVSFSKNSIVLNKVARERLNSSEVELAFDNNSKTVRIKEVHDGDMPRMAIKKTKIYGKGFFKFFDIKPKGKCEAKFEDTDKSLYVYIGNILH
ncbi:MAG TPA: hypothetical protein DCK76_11925 [Desulfotomaculum sp.]|nr:MAG: hypothetical protein XD78_1688 [Desulfotomaculum sp. 46_296]HAG12046.1 hypothetical protein [Desulfotomaculum sp.]HBY03306.1 hypothetical protein [Desulfotomaculum sp.]